ncbi:MAG: thiamine phosphate synthase [Pseudomonadota bacterium]
MTVEIRRGLYAITDSRLIPGELLTDAVGQAIQGGARVIQYRDKTLNDKERRQQAETLASLCREHDVPLIINDNVALAKAVNATGVHIGRHDTDIAATRSQLGPAAIIGVSCYNRIELAVQAAAAGADYVAFGRFFPSSTKPDAVQAQAALLQAARQAIDLPIVAIGGITAENGGELVRAGADLLAVIHGVFGQPDVRAAARRYAALFEQGDGV